AAAVSSIADARLQPPGRRYTSVHLRRRRPPARGNPPMLQTLHIRDLALIDEAEIRLDAGLNVLSGATGGGKSLLVTALRLLAGDRAAANLVRHGADELRIDGEFVLP